MQVNSTVGSRLFLNESLSDLMQVSGNEHKIQNAITSIKSLTTEEPKNNKTDWLHVN